VFEERIVGRQAARCSAIDEANEASSEAAWTWAEKKMKIR
jgi:hypothetical protein